MPKMNDSPFTIKSNKYIEKNIYIKEELAMKLEELLSKNDIDLEKETIPKNSSIYTSTFREDEYVCQLKVCSGENNLWSELAIFIREDEKLIKFAGTFPMRELIGQWVIESAKVSVCANVIMTKEGDDFIEQDN